VHRAFRARLWSTLCTTLALAGGVTLLAQNPRMRGNVGPERFTMRVVATGLENPWEVAWGPDAALWVTERTAFRVTRVDVANGSKQTLLTLDDVYQSVVQDGLFGLAFHPDLFSGGPGRFVYLAYTYDSDPGAGVTRRLRVRRYTYEAGRARLSEPTDLIDNLPAHDDHGGGRLVIGPDRKLYLSRGDQGSNFLANFCNPIQAQDLPTAEQVQARDWSAYQGKILRLDLDGGIPAGNPQFAGVRSHVYAVGFRNPQGLAFGPGGRLYASEHGPSTDDEVDLIEAGRNYGWPHVAGYQDDKAYVYANWSASSPTPCRSLKFDNLNPPPSVPRMKESAWSHPDFTPPIATLFTVPAGYDLAAHGNTTIAPAGIKVYSADAIPGWADSLLVTGMRTGIVYRLKLTTDGRSITGEPVEYFKSDNRYRDVAVHPDGRRIYVSTDSMGFTMTASGGRTDVLANPGSLLEFTYAGPR
jgi:PQQ-dependent dehydrogenase (s-GDH family)